MADTREIGEQNREIIGRMRAAAAAGTEEAHPLDGAVHRLAASFPRDYVVEHRAVNIRSMTRVDSGDNAGQYTVAIPPLQNVVGVSLGSCSLPTSSFSNVVGNSMVPVGIPLQVPLVGDQTLPTSALELVFETEWKLVSEEAKAAWLASGQDGPALVRATATSHTHEHRLQVPPRCAQVVASSVASGWLELTTESAHGLDFAGRYYRDLELGVRIVGSGLLRGVPELVPEQSVALALAAEDVLEVTGATTFRVRLDYLNRFSSDGASAATEFGAGSSGIYLQADMMNVQQLMRSLNEELGRLRRQVLIEFEVDGGTASVSPVPDKFEFRFVRDSPVAAKQYPVLAWEPLVDLFQAELPTITRNQLAKPGALLVPVVGIRPGLLQRLIGIDQLEDETVHRPVYRMVTTRLVAEDTLMQSAGLVPAGAGGKLSSLRGGRRANPMARTSEVAPLRTMALSMGTRVDAWRRNVMIPRGRYESPGMLAWSISMTARGLTIREGENANIFVTDAGAGEAQFAPPAGDFTPEQLRALLQSLLRASTSDDKFRVDYNTFTAPDTGVSYTRWSVAHEGCKPFGIRIPAGGSWARLLGFRRLEYRGRYSYQGDVLVEDYNMPVELNVVSMDDVGQPSRMVISTNPGNAAGFSSGRHRAKIIGKESLGSNWLVTATTASSSPSYQSNVMGRLRPGDALSYSVTYTAGESTVTRCCSLLVQEAWNPVSAPAYPSTLFVQGPAYNYVISQLAENRAGYVAPLGNDGAFCLLWALEEPALCAHRLLGFQEGVNVPSDGVLHNHASPGLRKAVSYTGVVGARYRELDSFIPDYTVTEGSLTMEQLVGRPQLAMNTIPAPNSSALEVQKSIFLKLAVPGNSRARSMHSSGSMFMTKINVSRTDQVQVVQPFTDMEVNCVGMTLDRLTVSWHGANDELLDMEDHEMVIIFRLHSTKNLVR